MLGVKAVAMSVLPVTFYGYTDAGCKCYGYVSAGCNGLDYVGAGCKD